MQEKRIGSHHLGMIRWRELRRDGFNANIQCSSLMLLKAVQTPTLRSYRICSCFLFFLSSAGAAARVLGVLCAHPELCGVRGSGGAGCLPECWREERWHSLRDAGTACMQQMLDTLSKQI